jgi:hypothetical protein
MEDKIKLELEIHFFHEKNTEEEKTVTSSLLEVNTNQLRNKGGAGWGGGEELLRPPSPTPVYTSAGIFKQSMGARNRVIIGLSRTARRN